MKLLIPNAKKYIIAGYKKYKCLQPPYSVEPKKIIANIGIKKKNNKK